MPNYVDRYAGLRLNGGMKPQPGIFIQRSGSDKETIYKAGKTRLDKLSQLYYNNPYSGWLIMLANPEYGGLEFNIPDQTLIVIPFPYESGLERYKAGLSTHKKLYGE